MQIPRPRLTNILSRRPFTPKTPTFSMQRLARGTRAKPTLSSYSSCLILDSTSGGGAGFSGSATPITSITSLCDRIMSLLILLVSGLIGRPRLSYCCVPSAASPSCSLSHSTTSSYGERPCVIVSWENQNGCEALLPKPGLSRAHASPCWRALRKHLPNTFDPFLESVLVSKGLKVS